MEETATIQTPAETSEPIQHSMLVSEINQKFPQCLPVFEKYGIAGCGGKFGPPEPLFIFAAAHRVPLREFVDELNKAVRGEWKPDRAQKGAPTSESQAVAEAREQFVSENLYKRFVFGALFV